VKLKNYNERVSMTGQGRSITKLYLIN